MDLRDIDMDLRDIDMDLETNEGHSLAERDFCTAMCYEFLKD